MIAQGRTAQVSLVVAEADTAQAIGSGDVPVLATPRVLALAEAAAVAATADGLELGQTTVGVRADVHHVKATPVGAVVTATATVTSVEGRRLLFEFSVVEGDETVAYGTHDRVILARSRFESAD
jgi:fluoroacetyl-CoA thioesterase